MSDSEKTAASRSQGCRDDPRTRGALTRRDWRDVDVRLILRDEEFLAEFGEETDWRRNRKLAATNMAWAALGEQMTGLPIDFQIDQMTEANENPENGARHALGLRGSR